MELTDFKTKEHVDTLEVDAVLVATGRAPYTQVRRQEGPHAASDWRHLVWGRSWCCVLSRCRCHARAPAPAVAAASEI